MTDRATVRLPTVLAGYACARTLMCCYRPWRVDLMPGDADVLEGRLRAAGATELADRFAREGSEHLMGATFIAHGGGDHCAFLDTDRRGCDLHYGAGLRALPRLCRNFPRMVTYTPAGVEAAFLLDCPTAAGIVASGPAPFTWHQVARGDWPFEPTRTVRSHFLWDPKTFMDFDDLEELRAQWWQRLDATDDSDILALLAMLAISPRSPEADLDVPEDKELPLASSAEDSGKAFSMLARMPARGALYRRHERAIRATFSRHLTREALEASASALGPVLSCVAGLALQAGGVHDQRPASGHFRGAGLQALLTAAYHASLVEAGVSSGTEAVADAVCLASQMVRRAASMRRHHFFDDD